MSYPTSLSDINYVKTNSNVDVRCRDLYVDGDVYVDDEPVTIDGVPPQGCSLELAENLVITSNSIVVPISDVVPSRGCYVSNITHADGIVTIPATGIYQIGATIKYEHNFNTDAQYVTAQIRKLTGVGAPQPLVTAALYYSAAENDPVAITLNNTVFLTEGDTIAPVLDTTFFDDGNQIVLNLSRFSVQRLR